MQIGGCKSPQQNPDPVDLITVTVHAIHRKFGLYTSISVIVM